MLSYYKRNKGNDQKLSVIVIDHLPRSPDFVPIDFGLFRVINRNRFTNRIRISYGTASYEHKFVISDAQAYLILAVLLSKWAESKHKTSLTGGLVCGHLGQLPAHLLTTRDCPRDNFSSWCTEPKTIWRVCDRGGPLLRVYLYNYCSILKILQKIYLNTLLLPGCRKVMFYAPYCS